MVVILLSTTTGCSDSQTVPLPSERGMMRKSKLLQMWELKDGTTLVSVKNPWDSTAPRRVYALVDRADSGMRRAEDLPEGVVIVEVPLQRSVIGSGVYASLVDELGGISAVSGLCDVDFLNDDHIASLIEEGQIANCGLSTSPNAEKILSLKPGAVLLSPVEGMNESARLRSRGVTIVELMDYLEPSPLGRAEWMRFIGRLYGRGKEADSIFLKVENDYELLRQQGGVREKKPRVLIDMIYGQSWSVPTSGSATGILINDAGGENPFESYTDGGSAQLAPEKVLHIAQRADVWLIRYYEPTLLSKSYILNSNPIYGEFEAFKKGNIYGANTLSSSIFEDGAFHPEKILAEFKLIMDAASEGIDAEGLRYFKKIR